MMKDWQLSASSNQDHVKDARLNNDGEWRSGKDDTNPWFQVIFLNVVNITAIATQGHHDKDDEFVSMYNLQYQDQNQTVWQNVTDENGTTRVSVSTLKNASL